MLVLVARRACGVRPAPPAGAKGGGDAELVAGGHIVDVAVDAQCVTWLDDDGGGKLIAMRTDGT